MKAENELVEVNGIKGRWHSGEVWLSGKFFVPDDEKPEAALRHYGYDAEEALDSDLVKVESVTGINDGPTEEPTDSEDE